VSIVADFHPFTKNVCIHLLIAVAFFSIPTKEDGPLQNMGPQNSNVLWILVAGLVSLLRWLQILAAGHDKFSFCTRKSKIKKRTE
jgi:hypothetical protein